MARITVEDCLEKIDSQYDLVLLAKERTSQLNAGDKPLIPEDNDKNTVIALREIGEGKISIKTLEDTAIDKLRIQREDPSTLDEMEDEQEDSFDKIYKGEISKSGTAILPSKRTRRIPEKINLNFEKASDKESISDKELIKEPETQSTSDENKSDK
tara:strand:+ start:78 stop:545 length:468 start_codon:yes stop_codon:yes gene_type:complete